MPARSFWLFRLPFLRIVSFRTFVIPTTLLVATPFVAIRAHAQATPAKVTTPSASSSSATLRVHADTLYKLAVKPEDYPEDGVAYLLDEGSAKFEADGRGTRTYRQVVQILKEDAVENWNEQEFSYSPGHERLRLNWIRVVKPDGTVISEGPSHEQDSDIPADMGDPVYSDRKVKRISITGVEPGTIIDYSYTREELKPYLAGDFFERWRVSTGAPVRRSRYTLDVPSSLTPNLVEQNVSSLRTVTHSGNRTLYTWTTTDVPPLKTERFAAYDSNKVLMYLTAGAPTAWAHIAEWYAGNARERYRTSPALTQKVHALVAHAKTRDDSLLAIYRWVAQDIRYVSIDLGMGGYQPRWPDSVLATGFGDCKDKTTLFITALHEIGIPAYPVLLRSEGRVIREVPSYEQLDHVIAAVKSNTGTGYQFAELTSTTQPFGDVLMGYQGKFGLVVFPDGKSEEIKFPENSFAQNVDSTIIAGTLDTAGYFNGRYTEYARGAIAQIVRAIFATPLDSTQRANFAKGIARKYFDNASGDSLVAISGKDYPVAPAYSVQIRHGRAARSSGTSMILALPPGGGTQASTIADELEEAPKRQFPIDASLVSGKLTGTVDMAYTLPAGWHAKLPPSVHVDGVFGSYASDYAQTGNVLHVTRHSVGAKGIYPPEQLPQLVSWFRAIGKDDVQFIVLEHETAAAH